MWHNQEMLIMRRAKAEEGDRIKHRNTEKCITLDSKKKKWIPVEQRARTDFSSVTIVFGCLGFYFFYTRTVTTKCHQEK